MIPSSLPTVALTADDGARAVVACDGGHVVTWVPAGEIDNRLFVSERSLFGPGEAIRGGIPVIFPQFGPFGSLPQHGFARRTRWSVVRSTSASTSDVQLSLVDNEQTRALWPHAFLALLDISIRDASLTVRLTVTNTGDNPFSFTAAFHPYFAMRDAFRARVDGLQGCRYRDSLKNGEVFTEEDETLQISRPLDRIYYKAPDQLIITDGDRALALDKEGFPEAVVWNPGAEGTNARVDFLPGEEHRMLCVEAAVIQFPVVLAPGQTWSGQQRMTAR